MAKNVLIVSTSPRKGGNSDTLASAFERGQEKAETIYTFRDIYLLATAADEERSAVDGAVKGLEGWIVCFEKSRLTGIVFGGGADGMGTIKDHPALAEAYEMGKSVCTAYSEVVLMRRWKAVLCMIMLLFSISACGKADIDMTEEISGAEYIENPVGEVQFLGMGDMTETNAPETVLNIEQTETEQAVSEETGGEEEMTGLEITAGGRTFTAVLYDNETAGVLLERLPLTLAMSELNGSEKYYYFSDGFPTDSAVPEGIHAGDLMLYGSDCLVLFYESFSTGYSYTPLGYIENPEGLSAALGSGDAEVSFTAG